MHASDVLLNRAPCRWAAEGGLGELAKVDRDPDRYVCKLGSGVVKSRHCIQVQLKNAPDAGIREPKPGVRW